MIRLHRGEVLEVVLARPERRNALTPAMLDELASLDPELLAASGAVLLRGEGKSFCGGFDLHLCREDAGAMAVLLDGLSRAVRAMRGWPLPVVACVHGAAIAGGCALLGGADVVVAASETRLGYPVVRLGVSPAVTAPFLRLAVGDGPARELLLEPDLIDAERALELGLVHELLETAPAALARAREISGAMAAKPGGALAATRGWLAEIEGGMGPAGAVDSALAASAQLSGGAEERRLLAGARGGGRR